MTVNYENVSGLPQVLAKLETISNRMRNTAAKKAVVAAARVIVRQARMNLSDNTQTGTLRRSLVGAFSKKRSTKDQVMVALVRARAGIKYRPKERRTRKGKRTMSKNADAYYAGFVEFGHLIVPRGGKIVSAIQRRRRESKGSSRKVRAYPYLAPAYRSHGQAALYALEQSLRNSLNNGPS